MHNISLKKIAKSIDYTCSIISGSLSAPLSRRDAKESTILGNSLVKPIYKVNMKEVRKMSVRKPSITSKKKFDK
jgi:hypothetical protein